jgi:antitoxin (DNA-binding transcriptional repressor) of toxin-antitoxin stability system
VKVSATDLAKDSAGVVDGVIRSGAAVQVQRHGQTVAEIRPCVMVSRADLIRCLSGAQFPEADRRELRRAMDAAAEVLGHAGRD